jgi:hypothetical protein
VLDFADGFEDVFDAKLPVPSRHESHPLRYADVTADGSPLS